MQTAREILNEPGAPVVLFDRVQLAFDEKVVLRNLSFSLMKGHTKIILGASGSGKSTILKIITGLLRSDAGVVWVNGQRVDQLTEAAADGRAQRPGHDLPGGRAVRFVDGS